MGRGEDYSIISSRPNMACSSFRTTLKDGSPHQETAIFTPQDGRSGPDATGT